ncbi:hypothetical protein [Aliikangiella sp. G2MR2-5]|uniref:hypothetical protein n=1 Tax=Aliikangiella sp. G2MR2-5 TaxID=2788943 RepID=UPI0018AC126B|nr:hypothetical protein [Aliikangiella sp. G2MR2-5]
MHSYEKLYAYDALSFSIWDKNVNLIYVSGNDFEMISAFIDRQLSLRFEQGFNVESFCCNTAFSK